MIDGPVVIVVGGGIAGCAAAVELAGRGARVTVVEKHQPGVGATGASAGMLSPQYESSGPTPAFHLGVQSREAWPAFAERLERLCSWDLGLRTDGMLVANRTPEEEAGARAALVYHHDAGLRGEVVTPDEARRHHEGVSPDVASWLWLPDEAQLDAQRLAVALTDGVRAAGGRVLVGAEALVVEGRSGKVGGVRLKDGRSLPADRVVVAAGAWSDGLEGLPRPLPVRPIRGQILRLRPTGELPWTLVADHQAHYLTPRVNDTVLIGSTMEDVGFDDGVTEEAQDLLADAAASLVPALGDASIVERWSGLRPISADRNPILGTDPELEGLLYATGAGRQGILMAPLVARLVADLATRGDSDVAWEPFAITRF